MTVGINRFDDGFANARNHPVIDTWLIRRLLAGMHPRAVAVAGGVSLRTAYRWQRDIVGLEDVKVGGYTATYVIRRGKAPIRVTEWRAG